MKTARMQPVEARPSKSSRRRSRRGGSPRESAPSLPQRLRRGIETIERDWGREQTVRAAASTAAVGGALLGVLVHRAFFLIPAGAAVYLARRPVRKWVPRILMLGRIYLWLKGMKLRARAALKTAMA